MSLADAIDCHTLTQWLSGVNNFSRDMEFMLGAKPNILPRISWFLISPLVLVVLISCYFYEWTPIVYNNEKAYPAWADYVGLVLIIVPFMQIPLFALHAIFRRRVSAAIPPASEEAFRHFDGSEIITIFSNSRVSSRLSSRMRNGDRLTNAHSMNTNNSRKTERNFSFPSSQRQRGNLEPEYQPS